MELVKANGNAEQAKVLCSVISGDPQSFYSQYAAFKLKPFNIVSETRSIQFLTPADARSSRVQMLGPPAPVIILMAWIEYTEKTPDNGA